MLSSIHPLGERGRGNRFGQTATAFVLGSVIGGVTTGAIVGGLGALLRGVIELVGGSLSPAAALTIVTVAGVVAVLVELTGGSLPAVHRQVNEDWLQEYRNWVYGFGFGFQLGAGVTTYITSAAVLMWLAAILFSGSLAGSVLIGATFGLTRGLAILTVRHVDSPADLVSFHRRLHQSSPLVWRAGSYALLGLCLFAGVAAIDRWLP